MAITNPDFELGDGVPTGWTLTTTGANTYADFSTFGGGVESFYWGWPGEADVSDWTGITGVPAEFDSAVHAYETWDLTWIDTWAHASGLAGYFNGKLHYDNQVGAFTAGLWITGTVTGSTAKIVTDEDHGAFGELTLINASAPFNNNEQITDTSTGDALVDISAAYIGEDAFDGFERWEWDTTVPTPVTAMFGGGVNPYDSFEGIWWVALPGVAAASFGDKWLGGGAPQVYENFEP